MLGTLCVCSLEQMPFPLCTHGILYQVISRVGYYEHAAQICTGQY